MTFGEQLYLKPEWAPRVRPQTSSRIGLAGKVTVGLLLAGTALGGLASLHDALNKHKEPQP